MFLTYPFQKLPVTAFERVDFIGNALEGQTQLLR